MLLKKKKSLWTSLGFSLHECLHNLKAHSTRKLIPRSIWYICTSLVQCVEGRQNQLIIFFSITEWHPFYGVISFSYVTCFGALQVRSQSRCSVGDGRIFMDAGLLFGDSFLLIFCGLFGKKEMKEFLGALHFQWNRLYQWQLL